MATFRVNVEINRYILTKVEPMSQKYNRRDIKLNVPLMPKIKIIQEK